MTGTDEKAVQQTLNIICSSFGEVGGKIESLDIVYQDKTITTPDLSPKTRKVRVNFCNELIGGVNLNAEDVAKLLLKARMDTKIINENEVQVEIPSYRIDILHEVDIVENVAIQYCINKIKAELPNVSTIAYENNWFKGEKKPFVKL